MNDQNRIAIVVNPTAGKGNITGLLSAIITDLKKRQVPFEVFNTNWQLDPNEYTHIYLAGGDGTLNYFINQFPSCLTPISLFRTGTGNDFFWKLYGTTSTETQIHRAYYGQVQPVDAGLCNGRLFINGMGIGFDGSVVGHMQWTRKFLRGLAGYYTAVLKAIFLFRSGRFTIGGAEPLQMGEAPTRNETEKKQEKLFMITIANGCRYGGDFIVAPEASITDGKLNLVTINAVSIVERIYYLPLMKKGKHVNLPFVKSSLVSRVVIEAEEPVSAHLDGELLVSKYFDVQVLPARFNFRI